MSFYLARKAIRRLPGIVIKAVPLPDPEFTEGFGARADIGSVCKKRGYKTALLVTDQTLFGLGFHEKVVQSLEENRIAYQLFYDIDAEPTIEKVKEGRKVCTECNADCIIALGGGTVLDSCKAIAVGNKGLHKFILAKTLPLITVPTTAGTGAEITVGAVVKNAKGVKIASVVVGLKVSDVVLDSELTINAPRKVTLSCGIDALSHGLEGVLADVKTPAEDVQKSKECVRLILENLPALAEEPHDIEKRQKLALAANYGGNAINKQLAGYVHAFAHSLGALYHISHGDAIARCLLPIVNVQKDLCSVQLSSLADYCGCETEELLKKVADLIEMAGQNNGFPEIEKKDYPKLIKLINADSINYSPPKTFSDKEIIQLLDEIKTGY